MEARDPALSRGRDAALLAPASLVIAVLFAGAVAGMAVTSLVPLGGEPSLAAWRTMFDDPMFADAVRFTLQITLVSTAAAAVAALGLAMVLRRLGFAARLLAALPVPVPHLIVATVAVLWLGPGGLAERLLGTLPADLVGDRLGIGITLVYVYKEAPFLALLILAACGDDLREREEAAAVLGASALQRARWVTWPAIRGPLIVGSIIVAAYVAGSFEVPLAVGPNFPPTLATYALEAVQGDLIAGQGTAAAALLLAAGAAIALAVAAVRFARDVEGA